MDTAVNSQKGASVLKRVIAVFMLIFTALAVCWIGFGWVKAKNREMSEFQNNNQKIEEASDQKKEDIHPLLPLDILGSSDNLSEEQWTAMLGWRQQVKQTAADNPDRVYLNGASQNRQVALTFDDGPDEVFTVGVLDVLKEYDVHATFFFKGNQLERYASVVKRAYEEGNLIESHAYSHQELNKMSKPDIDKEIVATDKAFARVLGVQPAMIRPPFGAINKDVLQACENESEKIILWSIDTLDWSQAEPEHIAQNVLQNVRPGDIILMHSCEDREATIEALPIIIEGLKEKGFEIVDLSELLGVSPYKGKS